ncbi:MAG: MscL family protein [Bacilli bacterium]
MTKEELEQKKAAKELAKRNKKGALTKEFKAFITRGKVVDLAVGVIMGNAFSAIVTAFTNILLSLCTWGVPGGIKGLVTVLPAANAAQEGLSGIGQSFAASDINAMAEIYQASYPTDANPLNGLKGLYTLHGTTYFYNNSAIIDWGSFINAIITFFIIAITLFVVMKVYSSLNSYRLAFEANIKAKEELAWAKEHPEAAALKLKKEEEAKAAKAAGVVVKPDNIVLLEEIRDEIKRINETEVTEAAEETD